ncbi:MAG: excinuclease ABC subunit UvrC [Candidatus Lokiarchaeota archaeon]|nr:excinuclease ABC subunit UvrC [Candidatus Lokiarchaeota archaeon]
MNLNDKDYPIEVIIKKKNLPDKPGIYIFKDKSGTTIYIGKAKSLKNRVPQYFKRIKYSDTHDEVLYGQKIQKLVANIADIDFIITENEKEALILENDMVKKHQPKFNVLLKDDKSFPWILITYSEKFPRIKVIRQPRTIKNADNKNLQSTKNKFFGPYIDVSSMRKTLKSLRKLFPYCSCKSPCKVRKRSCLNYQIDLCPAPCDGKITREKYLENINNIERVLSGDIEGIIQDMEAKMQKASEELNFELAAEYRDTISGLRKMNRKQAIVNYEDSEKINRDIVGCYDTLKKIGILIMHVRNGRLIGKTPSIINSDEKWGNDKEILVSFLEQFYLSGLHSLPEEIIIPRKFFQKTTNSNNHEHIKYSIKTLENTLEDRYKQSVKIRPPGTGSYTKSLLRIALKNVKLMVKLEQEYDKLMTEADVLTELGFDETYLANMNPKERNLLLGLKEIMDICDLDSLPRYVEGFDVSNWQQSDATASMVCFIDGKPSKSNYRSYLIRQKDIQGDFAMIQEVIERRYTRILREKKNHPDLVVIDGGKIQVNAAVDVLNDLKLDIPIVGLEKRKTHTKIDKVVYQEKDKDTKKTRIISKKLKEDTYAYKILQHISTEYHRRAIQHHRKRRMKRILESPLDAIPGIGKKTRIKILEHFGSLESVKNAELKDFQALLGTKRGKNIFNGIKKNLK